jgi:hypothetical protein
MTIHKIKAGRVNGIDADNFIGDHGQIFYNEGIGDLRVGDGSTPGGIPLGGGGGYTLPTATASIKGGVKIGSNININNGVISVAAPFSGSYNDLTDKPTFSSNSQTFTFNVAADDSTLRTISNEETVKFIGANGITTSSDAEGAITITGSSSLINGNLSVALNVDGTMTFPSNRVDGGANTIALWSSNQSSIVWRGDGGAGQPLQSVVQARSGIVNIGTTTGILTGYQTNYSWQFNTSGQMTFPDSTVQTTAWTGSVAYSNVTGTPTLATVATSGSYSDLTNKPTLFDGAYASLSGKPTLFSGSYNDLTNKPTIPADYTFNVAADDSTLRTIDREETVKFIGAGGITTASDAEGAITITQGAAAAGTLTGNTLASGVTASSLTSVGTLTGVTSNAATAFIAGDAAISGVALQLPREGALRNTHNGANNNMYFDVSTGGTSHGQFQFRSSNAFTNVLTMSPTAFNISTNAVVTARTPSFGRLPWNSAIDTELTIDNYRFRVSNQGGNFPQIISNTGGTVNTAWTAVAARSGSAITQTGSTGILLPNNSWTSLYTSAGMDNPGDTITVTLQDKTAGKIYRVTFMRSDDGSIGYNIIAERLL